MGILSAVLVPTIAHRHQPFGPLEGPGTDLLESTGCSRFGSPQPLPAVSPARRHHPTFLPSPRGPRRGSGCRFGGAPEDRSPRPRGHARSEAPRARWRLAVAASLRTKPVTAKPIPASPLQVRAPTTCVPNTCSRPGRPHTCATGCGSLPGSCRSNVRPVRRSGVRGPRDPLARS